jgi:hypothetical protein
MSRKTKFLPVGESIPYACGEHSGDPMQQLPLGEVRPTANQPQFVESELVEYGKIEEITQAGSGSTTYDGSSYS